MGAGESGPLPQGRSSRASESSPVVPPDPPRPGQGGSPCVFADDWCPHTVERWCVERWKALVSGVRQQGGHLWVAGGPSRGSGQVAACCLLRSENIFGCWCCANSDRPIDSKGWADQRTSKGESNSSVSDDGGRRHVGS